MAKPPELPPPPPTDMSSIHKRASEIVEKDTVLAYAVSVQLRKHVVGRKQDMKYDLLTRLAYEGWNRFLDLQPHQKDPSYPRKVLDLVTDITLSVYEILTDARIH